MPKRVLQLVCILALTFTMLGADDSSTTRIDQIGHKMVCQCGCGQILMECNHVGCPVSGPMIGELKAQYAAGHTEAAILQTFIDKYGPVVLAAPIRGGFDLVAWIVPYAAFFVGIVGVALLIVYWRRRTLRMSAGLPAAAAALPTDDIRNRIRRDTDYE